MGDSAAQQNTYSQQIRPEKLKEKHEQTIAQIEKLQEVERFLFQNLQSISSSAPDGDAQKKEIRKKIEDLVNFRKALLTQLSGMYTSAQVEVSQRRYDLADQIAVGETMKDELTNTQEQLDALEAEKRNKVRLVKVGEYEYSRYAEFRGIIKVIVYGCFIALLISFLMKQPWFPPTLGVAGLGITGAWVLITVLSRLFDNFRRDPNEWHRFVQTDGQRYKNEVAEGTKFQKGRSIASLLGVTCPKESFSSMGAMPHDQKKENFSYL